MKKGILTIDALKVFLLFFVLLHEAQGLFVFHIDDVNSRSAPIRNLAYDDESDTLFVGANSSILALNGRNLSEKQVYQNHSILNENLVLEVIDVSPRYLLACGTYKGICERRDLENIGNVKSYAFSKANAFVSNNEARLVTINRSEKEYTLYYARTSSKLVTTQYEPFSVISTLNVKTFAEDDSEQNPLTILSNKIEQYYIEFKAIVESNTSVYFLSQQQNSSKLSKQCRSMSKSVYEDIYISCQHGDKTFRYIQDGAMVKLDSETFVLVALFTDTEKATRSATGALCVFTETEIQNRLLQSRRDRFICPKKYLPQVVFDNDETNDGDCFNSSTTPELFQDLLKSKHYCETSILRVVVGLINITGTSDVMIPNGPEKIAARQTNSLHTVYIGKSDGVIKQYHIFMGKDKTVKIKSVNAPLLNGNQKGVKDIVINNDSVFVATEDTVYKLPEPVCEQHTSCGSCIKTGSSKCGWCILKQKCTEADVDQCKFYDQEHFWLPSVKGQCLEINHMNSITPFSEENSNSKNLQVRIGFVPEINLSNVSIRCKFKDSSTNVSFEKGVCDMLVQNSTRLKTTEIEIYAKEIIRGDERSLDGYIKIASRDFILYQCSAYKTCYDCQKNKTQTNCKWNHQTAQCDIFLGTVKDLQSCSSIDGGQISKIYKGEKSNLTFTGSNIFDALNYTCRIDQSSVKAIASATNDSLTCQNVTLQGPRRQINVTFMQIVPNRTTSIYAMKNRTLSTAKVEVYTCDQLLKDLDENNRVKPINRKNDCSSCKYFSQLGYECKWTEKGCDNLDTNNANSCLVPELTSISPDFGPIEGNTKVTITGINLGVYSNETSVLIGGATCKDVMFDTKRRLICRTGKVAKATNSLVTVTVNGESNSKKASVKYTYKNPTLIKILGRKKGIKAGGGSLMLKAEDLSEGSKNEIKLRKVRGSNTVDCTLQDIKKDRLECQLPLVEDNALGQYTILLVVDNNTEIPLENETFEYIDNPKLNIPKKLVSIRGGGTKFKITAKNEFNFTLLSSAFVVVGKKVEECSKSDRELSCTIPPYEVSSPKRRKKRDTSKSSSVRVVVLLDGFMQDLGYVTYKTNPTFKNLTEVFEFDPSKDELLVLQGKNLMLVVDDPELYTVQIGSGICFIKNLTDVRIVCSPPLNEPSPAPGDNKLKIRVKVFNLKLVLGEAEYLKTIDVIQIVVIVLTAVLVVGAIIMVTIIYKVKMKGRKEIEMILLEMSKLEEQTREEKKDEFASMQLTITDIKSDLVSTGIPYHDYQTFIMKILFPTGDQSDNLIRDPDVSQSVRTAMDQFETLLRSKYFMKSFIATLERQRKITMQDKAHISSMLAVVMMGRMSDFFQIVQYLLTNLVDSTPKKQHKVLFNRFDSITLRLLIYWMNIALYPYFKDGGGTSLFMLYRAIQTVVEKRPVDDVTGDAKNTLAEDRFLRSKIDFKILNLTIDLNGDGIDFKCEVLDCDTISQVKRKCLMQIYKNRPRSQMPSVEEVILEWRMGKSGKLQLSDFDQTSIKTDDKIKMNTLKHYNVIDNSRMALCYKYSPPAPGEQEDDEIYCNTTAPLQDVTIQMPTAITVENLEKLSKWHLEEMTEEEEHDNLDRKMSKFHIQEGKNMYLTSLMHTKLILQEYIHGLFENMIDHRLTPPVIHYFFCILDNMEKTKGVDQDTLQSWKSESYAIRIWATLTASPDILFDIDRPKHVDPCLKSINQLLIDSFHSTKITKDSSLQKLLFATEVPMYQGKVEKFFQYMSNTEGIDENQFATEMSKLSNMQQSTLTLKKIPALQKIYKFIQIYMEDILEDLEEDDETKDLAYRAKLENIIEEMDKCEE